MNELYTYKENIILPKGISQVPYSNEVNYATFSRVLNDTVASYKMYWLLAILDEIAIDHKEVEFKKLICKMVVASI